MNTIKLSALLTCLMLSACSSVAPLTYGDKTYTPTMSAAEMQESQNQIENIEKRARQQRREEMMDTADAIKRANEGNHIYLVH